MTRIPCFKSYDIRGRVPEELDTDLAFRLGVAYGRRFQPRRMALGRDVRPSGPALLNALAHGLLAAGAEVVDIGLCGTEEVYFAAFQPGFDGGIMVTASHNPPDYNGMKLVRGGARPVSGDSGLRELEADTAASGAAAPAGPAPMSSLDLRPAYARHLLTYVDTAALRPLRIVVNAGNGSAGLVIDALKPHLPFEFIEIDCEPDGRFPHGVPNPLLPEHRSRTAAAVLTHAADFGVAWDGDFDRCFLFDETGAFIEGYYIVGLLAEVMLARSPGARIVHDPRLTWNTVDLVQRSGGIPVQSKTGHAFIKERMRAEDAVYGGDMSAHHYFRDFAYCDNGNIPWLLVAALLSRRQQPLSALVAERQRLFPASGEINRTVNDHAGVIAAARERYADGRQEMVDGLSVEYPDWRFNLRGSNTEPLLRLNVEARGNAALMQARTQELLTLIDAHARILAA
jgi:phosphomannomutase